MKFKCVQIFLHVQVCLHMFTLDFLNQVANGLEKDSMLVSLPFSSPPQFYKVPIIHLMILHPCGYDNLVRTYFCPC